MTQTLEQRFDAFAAQSGSDMGAAQASLNTLVANRGDMTALTTTAKTNLVAAINELLAGIQSEAAARGNAVTAQQQALAAEVQARQDAIVAAKTELLGGNVNAALDTFSELGAMLATLNANGGNATDAITALANTRVSAHVDNGFTGPQKELARTNIGAAAAADVTALASTLGDVGKDYVATYNAAKAAALAA